MKAIFSLKKSDYLVTAGILLLLTVFFVKRNTWLTSLESQQTSLKLNVTLKGASDQPISQASVSIFAPHEIYLGKTNSHGKFHGNVKVPKGKSATVQTKGLAFRATKDVFIPRIDELELDLFFDKKEATSGNMHLSNVSQEKILDNINKLNDLKIRVTISSEKWLEKHYISSLQTALYEELSSSQKDYWARGYHSIKLRPLFNKTPYIEILAYNTDKTLTGAFLFKAGKIKSDFLKTVLSQLSPIDMDPAKDGNRALRRRFTIATSSPATIRAYADGRMLAKNYSRSGVYFWLNMSEERTIAVSSTKDEGPLLRAVVKPVLLKSPLLWKFPEEKLTSR